jgi:hypothetical protein
MGVNINIETTDGQRHPDWDYTRYGGDRDFASAFHDLDVDEWTPKGFPWEDDRIVYRPKDFAAFRALAAKSEWPERWAKAADILETNPEYWLYFSY